MVWLTTWVRISHLMGEMAVLTRYRYKPKCRKYYYSVHWVCFFSAVCICENKDKMPLKFALNANRNLRFKRQEYDVQHGHIVFMQKNPLTKKKLLLS